MRYIPSWSFMYHVEASSQLGYLVCRFASTGHISALRCARRGSDSFGGGTQPTEVATHRTKQEKGAHVGPYGPVWARPGPYLKAKLFCKVSSLCFLISTISKNSVTPIIITISTVFVGTAISIIPIEFFEKLNPYLFTGYINSYLSAFYDPIPWDELKQLFLVCFIWTIIFTSTAFAHFLKKDIVD